LGDWVINFLLDKKGLVFDNKNTVEKKRILFLLLAGAVFLFLPNDTLASAFTIQTNKQSLINDEEIIIAVSIDGLPANTKYFLQAAFTKVDQPTNYLGYTQNNNGQWYCYVSSPTGGSLADSFYSLITNNGGDWLGVLMAKADLVDSGFKGTGDYYLQVKRFTEGGSGTWSDNKIIVNISQDLLFTPTPTATILPSPQLTSGLTPTVIVTTAPTATQPTPTSIPTSVPAKAVYQIDEVKNEKGETLSSVKIYVDDQYLHHYVPEVLEFCGTCFCDDDKKVACGFGEHSIRLEKNGYEDWEETKEIKAGDAYSVNPVMAFLPSPTPSPTATPVSSLSPTGRISPSPSLPITSFLLSPTSLLSPWPFADFALAPKKITGEEEEILEENSGQVLGEEKEEEKKNSGWYFGVGAFYLGASGWRLARKNDNDIMEKLTFEEK